MNSVYRRLLVIAAVCGGCDRSPVDPGGPAVIDGYIFNAATNTGLNGATVTVGRRTATAVAGVFRISDLPEGPVTVITTRESYRPDTSSLTLHAGSNTLTVYAHPSDLEGAVTSIALDGVPVKMTFPGVMRFAAGVDIDGLPVRDSVTATVQTTGPLTAIWNDGGAGKRYVTVTATGEGSGTVTLKLRGLSASLGGIDVSSVAAKHVEFTRGNGCLLALDDTAWCWGGNYSGQLGAHTIPQCNGSACQYGGTNGNETPLAGAQGKKFVQVATAGQSCPSGGAPSQDCGKSCGLTASGEAWCWGSVPALVSGLTLKSLAVGSAGGSVFRVCGLGIDDKAYCRTFGSGPVTGGEIGGGMTFTSFAVGWAHTCGVDASGDAYCWGDNQRGQLGLGSTDANSHNAPVKVATSAKFSSVDLGDFSSCGLDPTGGIQCWGGCTPGAACAGPAPLPDAGVYVAFSHNLSRVCGLTAGGAADCWAGFSATRVPAPVPVPLISVSVGSAGINIGAQFPYYACGVGSDQTVYCWNDATSYRIGR